MSRIMFGKASAITVLAILLCSFAIQAQGPAFEWAVRTGDAGTSSIGQSIGVDPAGNVYTAGRFTGTVDFDPGAGIVNLVSAGSVDAFITKMDPSGNLIWAKRVGGTQDELIYGNAVDGSGNVYLTGSFTGTADFDPGTGVFNLTASPAFTDDIFILKLNPDGDFLWAKRIGASGFDLGYSIAVGPSGVVTTGSFEETVDFDPGPGTATLVAPAGQSEIFILKLDLNGDLIWAKRMGGTNGDFGRSITLDASENVYSTGFFRGTADFDPGPATYNLTVAGSSDIFVSKLDASGNFVWAKHMGGTGVDRGSGIKVDIGGNVYTTGDFHNTADFDPGVGTNDLVSAGFNDSFISKLDASGNFIWARRIGGAIDDESTSLTLDAAGNVYHVGDFQSTVDFDPGTGTFNLTSLGSSDVFISKLDPAGSFVWALAFEGSSSGETISGIHVDATGGIFTTGSFSATVDFNPGAGVSNLTAVGIRDIFISKLSQAPTIASFTPTSGPVGTVVTITGDYFSATASNNIVYLGGVRANVSAATNNQLTVTVPAGAAHDRFSVTVNGLTGFSQNPFIVSFGSGQNINASSFAPKVDLITELEPYALAQADFDQDGKLDIVSANYSANTVSIFLNTSTGPSNLSFAAKVDFLITPSGGPYAVTTGDFDGDGKLDFAVANEFTNTVSLFRNTSTGPGNLSFAALVDFPTGTFPHGITSGDFNLDGKPDLAVTSNNLDVVSVYVNTSSGPGAINFAARVDFSTGIAAQDVAQSDLDGDGKADLVVANYSANTVSVLLNTSASGFLSFAGKVDFPTGDTPNIVSIGDVDGDGKLDLAVANGVSETISFLRNTSSLGILSFAAKVDVPSTGAFAVAMGDLNGDGKVDVAAPDFGSSVIASQNTSTGPGNITFGVQQGFTTGNTPQNVTIGDFDGDGKPDMAVANSFSNTISVLRNTIASSCVPLTQRAALIALYNATDGANWDDNTGWLSADESTWFGVTVSGCNVVDIALPGNNLIGTLPPEIGDLPLLEGLDLGANQLNGWIPPEIGNLSSLIALNLSLNQMDGPIPVEIGNLTNLQALGLAFNLFHGNLPLEMENLSSLTDAFLNNNQFSGDAPLIGGSSVSMSNLEMQFNSLTNIPDFNGYYNINSINVASNRLTFDDLEPYMGLSNFFYDPQAQVPPGGIISFIPGGTLNIPFSTGGTANSYQWYKDNVLIPLATSASYTLAGAPATAVGTYQVRITNSIVTLLTLTSASYLVITDPCASATPTTGDIDVGFAPLISAPSNFLGAGLQSTGKIITSTGYTIENSIIKSGVLRFNADGTLDNTFSVNPYAGHFLVQPDDKIIVTHFDGSYSFPVRLNADGTDDASFNSNVPQYYSGSVNALAYQTSDDKILVAATAYMTPPFVERLNPDGTPDGVLPDADGLYISVITVQSDGYILVGGEFSGGIRRLDPAGVLDPTFTGTASDFVMDIVEQPDGKILVAGLFYLFNDVRHYGIVRLNGDGSVDNTFLSLSITDPIESGHYATKIALQPDGKIVLAGRFETIDGASRRNLVRLNADGTVDCSFDPVVSTDTVIRGLAIQSDGKILITGDFTDYNGTQRYGLARVNNGGIPIITITLQPVNTTVCATSSALLTTTATGTTNITYQWQRYILAGSILQNIPNGGAYSGVTTSAMTIDPSLGSVTGDFYRCVISGDGATTVFTDYVTLTISPGPPPPTTTGAASCSSGSLTLTAAGGVNGDYGWYTVATAGTAIPGEVNNTYTTPVLSATTIYHVALFDGTCESNRTPVTATIEVVAKPTIITSNCTAVGATLTGPGGFPTYSWSNGATTQQIAVTLAGSYTLTVTSSGGCLSPVSDPVTFTSTFCNQPPVIQPTTVTTTIQSSITIDISSLTSDLDNNIDMTTLQVVVQPLSGATASVNANFEIVVDYAAVNFVGTDQLTIQICDVSGACVQQVITIEVAGDITVYNALSPNGDGKNDVFFIQYINALPETQENKVTILNRWGSVVFETTNYDNTTKVFRGLSSDGVELPTGTYYYVLEFSSGASKRTGFISLRR